MDQPTALVTGAGGEMGHLLLPALAARGHAVVALDLAPLPPDLAAYCREVLTANVLEPGRLQDAISRHRPTEVFHLAALLSRQSEKDPYLAHRVNVGGTLDLLALCRERARDTGQGLTFLFPSSIAVYGLPDRAAKEAAGPVPETAWTLPTAMYGCNKLYCELVGTYYADRAMREGTAGVDFRALRFPGLISADTLPSGGTTDYASEMIHAAATGTSYACFVREDTRLPFMTMPDAVDAFLSLAGAPAGSLSRRVYNLKGFSPSAGEIRTAVLRHFPDARISFVPVQERQALVDTWPEDVDDSRARADWGLAPAHGLEEALRDYLIPALRRRSGARAGP